MAAAAVATPAAVAAVDAQLLVPVELDQWTQAEGNDVIAVDAVVALPDDTGRMLVTLDGAEGAASGQVGGWQPRATAGTSGAAAEALAAPEPELDAAAEEPAAAALYMVDRNALPSGAQTAACFSPIHLDGIGPGEVDGLWPGSVSESGTTMLLQADNTVFLLLFHSSGDGPVVVTKLLDLPPGARETACTWSAQKGGLVVAAIDDGEPSPEAEPVCIIYPRPEPSEAALAQLTCYTPMTGWMTVAHGVSLEAEALQISMDGSRCVYKVFSNPIPEESEAGEFWGATLSPGAGLNQLTRGAGRVEGHALSDDGRWLVYQANHEKLATAGGHPITTHLDLYLLDLSDAIAVGGWGGAGATKLTEGGRHINAFGWRGGDSGLWATYITGVKLATEIFSLMPADDGLELVETMEHAATTTPVFTADGAIIAYGTESGDEYATLWIRAPGDGGAAGASVRLQLPGQVARAALYSDLHVETVIYGANSDDTPIVGLLYEKEGTPIDAPLIVHAHGGPAVATAKLRSAAANTTRYPFRHLLKAGYRVFQPFFRGGLGFGDEFSQANIGSQGSTDSDLGDILSGLDHLIRERRLECEGKIGIFGGSYGGYMTLRAMAVCPERFATGIAQYGFVQNRWMTYEGGDYTWEDEYQGHKTRWPLTAEDQKSDVYNHLASITSPLLLMHGEDDDICPLSQSLVAYRVLKESSVPTGLIVYPKEKHGFDQPVHRRDRDRRMLSWLAEFLPSDLNNEHTTNTAAARRASTPAAL